MAAREYHLLRRRWCDGGGGGATAVVMAEAKAGVEKVMVGRATALALRIAAQNDPNLWPLIRAMPKRRHATARGILEMIAAQADVGARKDEMKT